MSQRRLWLKTSLPLEGPAVLVRWIKKCMVNRRGIPKGIIVAVLVLPTGRATAPEPRFLGETLMSKRSAPLIHRSLHGRS
jgi:hypothetical protein